MDDGGLDVWTMVDYIRLMDEMVKRSTILNTSMLQTEDLTAEQSIQSIKDGCVDS